jgi:hypothetical protein
MPRQFIKSAALVLIVVVSGATLVGCSQKEQDAISNVKPPTPGTPATGSDISGIYRSLDQALLQLRGDGSYVLIVKDSKPTAGQFTVASGQLEVQSEGCGPAVGRYGVVVTGEKKAGKAKLDITPMSDDCARRKKDLAAGPWVYADS